VRDRFHLNVRYELPNVYLIAGARPSFIKIAPIIRAIEIDGRLRYTLIHTGQHYDRGMNDVFFDELGISATTGVHGYPPALGIGSHFSVQFCSTRL